MHGTEGKKGYLVVENGGLRCNLHLWISSCVRSGINILYANTEFAVGSHQLECFMTNAGANSMSQPLFSCIQTQTILLGRYLISLMCLQKMLHDFCLQFSSLPGLETLELCENW